MWKGNNHNHKGTTSNPAFSKSLSKVNACFRLSRFITANEVQSVKDTPLPGSFSKYDHASASSAREICSNKILSLWSKIFLYKFRAYCLPRYARNNVKDSSRM